MQGRLNSGIRIFEYQQAKLHTKVITIDGVEGNIGSSNFENRSLSSTMESTSPYSTQA
jgi:phosphatidylserine/phosphatidylglycerophosphate/cardiolipin synthase-like enzyme